MELNAVRGAVGHGTALRRYLSPMGTSHPLLRDVYPDLTAELSDLLERQGERELASGVRDLRLVDECGCGDESCQSLRTAEHSRSEPYGPGHRNIMLDPQDGMLILDVVHERIMYIEMLERAPLQRHVP